MASMWVGMVVGRMVGMSELVVIVVFVPSDDPAVGARVRTALAEAGAGRIGAYRACSFSAPGQGRFEPDATANPFIGAPGRAETVAEERLEAICERRLAKAAVLAMLAAHPYEEPAYHVYPVLTVDDL
jgi:hypothetical protein